LRRNKKINSELSIKNNENEFLLKEIHHRVKNNLQILSSLLSLQSDSEEDQAISGALQESRNRVESMGLIHQKLYAKDKLTSINMKEYVQDLSNNLMESFVENGRGVKIESQVEINDADVETAIPLGLIINELVTNSLKYAFHGRKDGQIHIKLWEPEEGDLKLSVADDGKGEINDDQGTNFGSRLINILAKKLKGKMITDTSDGYVVEFSFSRYQLA